MSKAGMIFVSAPYILRYGGTGTPFTDNRQWSSCAMARLAVPILSIRDVPADGHVKKEVQRYALIGSRGSFPRGVRTRDHGNAWRNDDDTDCCIDC